METNPTCPECGKPLIYVDPEPRNEIDPESPAEWWCSDDECDVIVIDDDLRGIRQ